MIPHESGEILFISSSRRQLNDRNSEVELVEHFLRFFRYFRLSSCISNSLDPQSRGETSILLGDNSEIVPDRSSRRAKPALGRKKESSLSFRLTFHSAFPARTCGKVHSRTDVFDSPRESVW